MATWSRWLSMRKGNAPSIKSIMVYHLSSNANTVHMRIPGHCPDTKENIQVNRCEGGGSGPTHLEPAACAEPRRRHRWATTQVTHRSGTVKNPGRSFPSPEPSHSTRES